jgi:hypothetical protein
LCAYHWKFTWPHRINGCMICGQRQTTTSGDRGCVFNLFTARGYLDRLLIIYSSRGLLSHSRDMSDVFPLSTSSSFVNDTAPVVQYPPEYFGFGAAGFRHVSTVLNDLALAASSIQAALPSAKPLPLTTGPQLNAQRESDGRTLPTTRRRDAPAPYSTMRDSRGYSIWRAVIVCLHRPPIVLLADLSLNRIAYLLRPRNASRRRMLVVAMGSN